MLCQGGAEPLIYIYAFGPLRVQTATDVFEYGDLVGRKPRLLLERLLIGRNSVVHKTAIAEALWPRKAPQSSSATIESYVSLLRKRLFDDRDLARKVIVTSSEGYRLNTAMIGLDLDRFDELTSKANEMAPGRETLEIRLEAEELYRGPVLEDAPDEPWLQELRRTYQDRVSLNRVMIAKAQLADRHYAAAIRSAQSVIDLEPYSEEAYRLVMLAQYAMGHQHAARRTYERIRDIAGTELGVDLTSVTEELAAAMDAGECPKSLVAATTPNAVAAFAPVDNGSTITVDSRAASRKMPFLGRVAELDSLHHLLSKNITGIRTALVTGVHGVGKTALLDQLQTDLALPVGRTNYRRLAGFSPSGRAPGLRQAIEQATGQQIERQSDDPQEELNAIARCVSNAGPIALLLDNLDLASPAEIECVRWLKKNVRMGSTTLIATVSDLAKLGRSLDCAGANLLLHLAPLTQDDVRVSGALGLEIQELCGGNPLFMADMWRWRAAGFTGAPSSLLAYVEQRVHTLNEPLIEALSILIKLSSAGELGELMQELQDSLESVNQRLDDLASESCEASGGRQKLRGAA